jgi:ABC-type anion transport system duplicated permease subunit
MAQDLPHTRRNKGVAMQAQIAHQVRQTDVARFRAGAVAAGATATGALAVGALAIGALAIGRLVVGRLKVRSTYLQRVEIDELVVRRLRVSYLDVVERTPAASDRPL